MTTIPERIQAEARRLLDSLGSCNCSECTETAAQALLAAEKRGREEALFWQKARMRAAFIEVCDKLPPDALEAITNAMNTLSDEMEAARSTN